MKPVEQYLAKLRQEHEGLRKAWNTCLVNMTGGQPGAGKAGLQALLIALDRLQNDLTSETTPKWLLEMKRCATTLTVDTHFENDLTRTSFFLELSDAAKRMQPYTFDESSAEGVRPLVNIDVVVAKHHNQGSINKIYDEAIKAIRAALDNDQIDSIRIQKDLRQILATIEEARESSFVNQLFQIPNLQMYLRAIAKVAAKKVPVLNFVLEVVEEAKEQLDQSNQKIHEEIQEALREQSKEIGAVIEHQPVVSDNLETKQLPAPGTESPNPAEPG